MTLSASSSKPRVSVALCTCNGKKFLGEQLQSIAGQSRAVDEIIICDDASTDGTVAVIKQFSGPVQLHINPVRLGVTKNFEKAISHCTGEIIFLCDQDDVWHRQKVETLLARLQLPGTALAFSNAAVVRENLSPAGYRLWESIWFNQHEQQQMRSGNAAPVLLHHAVAAGSTLAFRAEYLPLILPIPDFPNSHDIWITLLLGCAARIDPVDEDLIQYRLHNANQVGMRRRGLAGQIKMARWQIAGSLFQYAADLHEAARDRLSQNSRWPTSPAVLKLLEQKIHHSRLRHHLPKWGAGRLRQIAREIGNGNYRRYSYGTKSVLQDLFLR